METRSDEVRPEGTEGREAYAAPELVRHGTVGELTEGGVPMLGTVDPSTIIG